MVTIGDIIEDVNPFTEKGAKVVTVAVVPRDILSEVLEDLEGELQIMKAVERSQYATEAVNIWNSMKPSSDMWV